MSPVVPPFHPSHPPFPPRRRLTVAASMTARLLCSAALLAATRYAPAADLFYLGAQYTPGPGLPAPWPTDGSWFDKNLWQNNTLPTSTTNAIFGSNQPMPNTNTTHAPHTLHFGNFGYYGTTTIPGGTATLGTMTILQDNWTLDFASGQNPDFTGTLTPSTGSLTVGTLSLAPATGQSASLTLQNGTLTATTLQVATQTGQALITLTPGACLKASSATLGISGSGSVVQNGGNLSISGSFYAGANVGATGIYTLNSGLLAVANSEYLGDRGSALFTQTGGTHTVSSSSAYTFYLGRNSGSTGSYILSNGQFTAQTEYLGYSGTGSITQTGGTHTSSGYLFMGSTSTGTAGYSLSGGAFSTGALIIGGYISDPGTGAGTFAMSGGSATIGYIKLWNSKALFTLSGGTLRCGTLGISTYPSGLAWTAGTLQITGNYAPSLTIPTAGTFQPAYNVQGDLTNNGVLDASASLSITGNYTQSSTGSVNFDITGTQYVWCDRITVSGRLTLAGTIAIRTVPSYTPALNDTFKIFSWTGTPTNNGYSFDFSKAPLPSTLAWNTSTFATTGQISIVRMVYNRTWLGSQYTPGPDYPAPWPTRGSWFDSGNWLGNAAPSTYDTATFGSDAAMPNGNTTHDPHIVHFGNFGYVGTTVIPGGAASTNVASFLSDSWTFDFASGQNPDFTGTLTPSVGSLSVATLTMSPAAGQSTSLTIQNGALTITSLTVGTQAGSAFLAIGPGATVQTTSGTIGVAGSGIVNQSGGSNRVSSNLYLGYSGGSTGSYTLTDGTLNVTQAAYLGYRGRGDFTQTGGTHTVGSALVLGPSTHDTAGTYRLAGGQLNAPRESLGNDQGGPTTQPSEKPPTGTFTQEGGTNTTGALQIGLFCLYQMTGGTLQVTGGLANTGSLSISGPSVLNVSGGFIDLAQADLQNLNQLSLTLAADSILVLPAGVAPEQFGAFVNNGGQVARAGDTVTIAAGTLFNGGQGSCSTPVLCEGTLTGTVSLYYGIRIPSAAGTATLVSLRVEDLTSSSLTGGVLTVSRETLGYAADGGFTQWSGTHTATSLNLGGKSGVTGTYTLNNGRLSTDYEYVGSYRSGTGSFTQNGGTHSVSSQLMIGLSGSGIDAYSLNNGTLSVSSEYVGAYYGGTFKQIGGTHTLTGPMVLGAYTGSTGTYSLSGNGILSAANLYVGGYSNAGGTGTLAISGGTATITNTLKLWNTPNTTLTLSGGTLSAKTLNISLNPAAFSWTAGTLIITGPTAPALTIPAAGTFLGTPTIAGPLTNYGTLSPGQSPGLLTIQGDFTQSDTATLLLEIAGPALPDFDRLSVPGTSTLPGNITLAGTVALSFFPAYTPALGDSFDFLDWTGTFTPNGYTFDFTRAPLPTGWTWDTSAFNTTGQLTITQPLPEPASLALLALAAPFLLTRRRP